jgi:hypothetical protein
MNAHQNRDSSFYIAPLPFLFLSGLAFAVWGRLNRYPAMTWLGSRRQRLTVSYGCKVWLFAALWTYLLKNAATAASGRAGFVSCHGFSPIVGVLTRSLNTLKMA